MGVHRDYRSTASRVSDPLRQLSPTRARRWLTRLYWRWYDAHDFLVETIGWIPLHSVCGFLYGRIAQVHIGQKASMHRGCRFYRASGVQIGARSIVNRDVLLDGRIGLKIGDNVSISEGAAIFTLEHDPNSANFADRGAAVRINDRVFVGARAIILPGVTVKEGAVVAAGAVVTRDVAAFSIVGGVPAKPIGQRRQDLTYTLDARLSSILG